MMTGRVTTDREVVIELEVVGSDRAKGKVEAVMDTGFNGYLILPSDLSTASNFNWRAIDVLPSATAIRWCWIAILRTWCGMTRNVKYLSCKPKADR